MQDTESRIAVLDALHDDTHREEIVNLLDGLVLVDHLSVNAEEVLGAPVDLGLDACLLHLLSDLVGNLLNKRLAVRTGRADILRELLVNVGL